MNKVVDAQALLRQLKELPLEDREQIAAALLEGIHEEGGHVAGDIESDADFIEELERRADDAFANPDRSAPAEETIAKARAALTG